MVERVMDSTRGYCPYCGNSDIEYQNTEYDGETQHEEYVCIVCDKEFVESYEVRYYQTVYDDDVQEEAKEVNKTNVRW